MNLTMDKDESGFSLVEMLIVVGIIGLLAAISIPLLRKAKNQADSGSAIATVRTLVSAERLYQLKNNKYADLAGLVPEGTLDTTVQSGLKSGYVFSITTIGVSADQFTVTADPTDADPGLRHFFADETAVIRFNVGGAADVTSSPL